MDRKAMAKETLKILNQGYYEPTVTMEAGRKAANPKRIIKDAIEQSIERSILISPAEGEKILEKYHVCARCDRPETRVENIIKIYTI